MTKLSDKVRIVTSDGKVVREANRPDTPEEQNIMDKVKGRLPFGKTRDEVNEEEPTPLEYEEEPTPLEYEESDVSDEGSFIDKIKGLLPIGKNEPVVSGDELEPQFPDAVIDEEDSGGIPEEQRKFYIGGIIGLVVLMVVCFVWFISTSQVDSIDVDPEEIESEEVAHILEGDPDSFEMLVNSVGIDVMAEEDESEIQIDVPEEKEALQNRIYELEEELSELQYEIDVLEGENKGLWTRVNSAEDRVKELEAGEDR